MGLLLWMFVMAGYLLPATVGVRLVCYYPNWALYRAGAGKYTVDNIDPSLCTHFVYAFAVLDGRSFALKVYDSWGDIDLRGYSKFIGLKTQNPSLKMMISLGGWTDSTDGSKKYSKLVSSSNNIANFVTSVIAFLQKYGFDGLDIDWEYPSTPADKAGLSQLLKALRTAFGPRGYLLSIAVPANPKTSRNGYDLATVVQTVDFVNLMTYVLHGPWERNADHMAPLHRRPWDRKEDYHVSQIVDFYLENGLPAEKLNLGIPLYGHSWRLSSNVTEPPAPASGPGAPGPFTRQAGMLGYHEICANTRKDGWVVVQDPQKRMGPYAHSPTSPIQWVGYDDAASAVMKSKYALSMGLGGVVIWELSTDDFNGLCGGGTYPITTAVAQTVINLKISPQKVSSTTTSNLVSTSSTPSPIKIPSSGICPLPNGHFRDPASCSTYYNCDNGRGFKMSCPSGLFFHPTALHCDWPINVPSCSSKGAGTTVP